eukprot:ANDGO_05999.mRNA.1 hypothetical protein
MLCWDQKENGFLGILGAKLGANRASEQGPDLDYKDNYALDRRSPERFRIILRYLKGIVDGIEYEKTPKGLLHLALLYADADFYGLARLKKSVLFNLRKLVMQLVLGGASFMKCLPALHPPCSHGN